MRAERLPSDAVRFGSPGFGRLAGSTVLGDKTSGPAQTALANFGTRIGSAPSGGVLAAGQLHGSTANSN